MVWNAFDFWKVWVVPEDVCPNFQTECVLSDFGTREGSLLTFCVFLFIFILAKAKALYTYTPSNADELAFDEGDEITIIDTSEEEWWKTEREGVVFIVPAAYLEVVEG